MPGFRERHPAVGWIAPFAAFMLWLAAAPMLGLPQPWDSVLRVLVPGAVIVLFSGHLLAGLRVGHAGGSVALGLAVFALWVAPDLLVPGWRAHWLFQNAITGSITTTIDPTAYADPLVVALRVARAAILVPILEELFWRGWLPRWIVDTDWRRVPLGRYTTLAFVATALLFASEHGPYWEVGLACGLLYNWWMWRTRSLGDLILTHAVTNAALSVWVLVTGRYEYWM
jgi:CAAX prenyl protease-like protein